MESDVVTLNLAGLPVYLYGLFLAGGVLLCALCLIFLASKKEALLNQAVLGLALGLPLSFLLSRLVYCLLDPSFWPLLTLRNALSFTSGGYAMYGALGGAVLGAWLSSLILKQKAAPLLDILAPALFAFLILARLGEQYTVLGLSRPLVDPFFAESFLAKRDTYDAYLRTYLLESLSALILMLVLLYKLKRPHREGSIFLMGCLLYGLSQTLWESLRYDGHLRFSFIGVQQLLSAVLFTLVILFLALRSLKKERKAFNAALILLPLVWGGIIGIEFVIDRSPVGKLAAYLVYTLLLILPGILGMKLIKKADTDDKRAN